MLNINDYNQLKLLYNNFFKFSTHIKNLIKKEDWESVDIAVQEKEGLIRQIIFFEKPRIKEIKENDELNSLRLKLIELEKENIVLINNARSKLVNDVANINKTKKIINAYEPSTNKISSTIDIKEDCD